ncbi:siroheme synthase CysG [Kordiimonas sp. SCSIO 12610]|uniref:siroheme synthase CysG n=1 Tax=Kordiimonas sp. SCSIO 12610 TaxID=2829597 RepID=UPI00210DC08F|nr:siroheme synthase CysG [Kordiimonas sp. SCSIO 12610]UTW55954.1 uroporphyrinogen-III C-methyltransferase [Kordiimonas sp. SCSIO 12610]
MKSIPIFLTAEKHHILILGSDSAAMAKVALLQNEGAEITVIAAGAKAALLEAGLIPDQSSKAFDKFQYFDRPFVDTDIDGKTLIYASTAGEDADNHIVHLANSRGIPVNIIDMPSKSNFITPAQFKRGPLHVAFSSGGVAPVFVRRLRATLERILPQSLGTLAEAAGNTKDTVKSILSNGTKRRLFWDNLYDRAQSFAGSSLEEMENRIVADAQSESETKASKKGFVQLVGSGPGDPDLLTIKAHRALQQADVIVYDRLVSREVIALARRDAELIYVGKKEGNHGIGQDGINNLLVKEASAGKRVVRLKSGDPMVFGRIAEEMAALRAHNINLEVVPGITALTGIASKTQIPLTDRAHASSITLVTAHLKDGSYKDWANLAGEGRTLGIYMGVKSAANISAGLQDQGVRASMPVAIIQNGTRENERRFFTTLIDLPATIAEHDVKSPALLLIGDVVTNAAEWPEDLSSKIKEQLNNEIREVPTRASA